ncbi:hypothetical protein [Thiohalocapsa sp. ML1]|jgi:hypothetical protein|uniref:hypothetical protein n=1 Tax=Thiohalocapsa sp. ML1 TaxID=1431688 RepID=UPI0007321142|nr:hypothetical protein [Thiohalocapsa sp. ML1]
MAAKRVLLDLNFPAFQADLFNLDVSELKPVLKTLRKLRGLDWPTLYRDHGLNWEQIKDAPGRFTIRLSQRSRAVVRRDGDYVRFIALHTDHDSAYGKK